MDEEMTAKGPTTGLEQKIDALAAEVRAGFKGVDERLIGVEGRLTGVERRLTDVEKKLRDVHDLAQTTNEFSKNVYDQLTSLETKVENGFRDAKKHQNDQFQDVHAAIHRWGERVGELETRPVRTTKRRR